MSASLVGSEMCIRDRPAASTRRSRQRPGRSRPAAGAGGPKQPRGPPKTCLLYTSDAADDM
eukprot:9601907-Alexandrium_andersonii.AAC.1